MHPRLEAQPVPPQMLPQVRHKPVIAQPAIVRLVADAAQFERRGHIQRHLRRHQLPHELPLVCGRHFRHRSGLLFGAARLRGVAAIRRIGLHIVPLYKARLSRLHGGFLPNPAERATRFLVSLSETADVEITIYTVTGRKIATLEAVGLSPERGRTEGLPWEGLDEDGDPLANGVYFYRAVARAGSGQVDELIERLAVYR